MKVRHFHLRKQSGVGLIEILIAVLVLSIGFLGMAALQAQALSNNNSAMARSMGTIASYSILDAMRVDLHGVQASDYDGKEVEVPESWNAPGDCGGNAGSLYQTNINNWCDDLGSLMGPGTVGKISADGDGGNYIITVTFDDERATGGVGEQTIVTRAKL
ncbi:MAG: type IV pilus modification protein PilV [Halothiobacillaceae bacterium]